MRHLPLVLASTLAACAQQAGGYAPEDFSEFSPVAGQAILFVGTDPQTFTTDLYVARGQTADPTGGLLQADAWDVEPITSLTRGGDSSPLLDESDALFSDEVPFPSPSWQGDAVLMVATVSSGVPAGRLALVDLEAGRTAIGPDIDGLVGARFDWSGSRILLSFSGGDTAVLPREDLDATPVPLQAADGAPLRVFELLSDGTLLVAADRADTAQIGILDLDADAWTPVGPQQAELPGVVHAAPQDGLVAWTAADAATGSWQVWVEDEDGARPLTDPVTHDCPWFAWRPGDRPAQLTATCMDRLRQRPDIAQWTVGDAVPEWPTATSAQPALAGGSLDGHVLRSPPQWDPLGDVLVFGASTADASSTSSGMTLLGLRDGQPLIRLWSTDASQAGWAHFSAASPDGALLLWDRTWTGLQSSLGGHPIQIVAAASLPPRTTPVDLGRDLLVAYPMFLAGNSLRFP